MKRISTGLPALDEMLSGGLLSESVSLVSGSPGAGKSTLATQFVLEGIRRGENGAYISLEEDKQKVYRNMAGFGWDLQRLEDEGRLYFEFFRTDELLRHITDGYQVIDHELRKVKAKRLVLDSVTAYLLASDDELWRRNELKRLLDHMRRWKVTSLFTAESQAEGYYGVDYMVDTIIRLHQTRPHERSVRQRFVEVEKMRGSRHSMELHKMEITDLGVIIGQEPIPVTIA